MKRLFLCTAALIGVSAVTAVAQAQTMGQGTGVSGPLTYDQAQAYGSGSMMDRSCGRSVAIKDEYGFRYDSMGDRIDARGCVIAPPVTPPGGRAIQR